MAFERKSIAAYTDLKPTLPGYVSVNQESEGVFSITVRSPGEEKVSRVDLTTAQMRALVDDIRFEGLGFIGAGG